MRTTILVGDARERLRELPAESVHCVVTSPPYWGLRSYTGDPGMIGLEPTFGEHLDNLIAVFREVRRVLRPDGTLWLNYGDAYAGGGAPTCSPGLRVGKGGTRPRDQWTRNPEARPSAGKPKDLMMMPARVAMALQADGWWLRSEIIWHKPNPMPESVRDRPTCAHEKVFLMSRSARYFYDADAVREAAEYGRRIYSKEWRSSTQNPGMNRSGGGIVTGADPDSGRNLRNVWSIPPRPFRDAHFATFPHALVEPCVKAGCPEGGTVLDPFGGAGTVGLTAMGLGRNAVLIEISEEYAEMARARLADAAPMFYDVRVSACA